MVRLQASRRRADDSFEWDKRARHFRPLETAPYARDFIKLLALEPRESVLDMGCGAGSIAIPLAQAGHPVIAADFSPAMLGTLDAGIEYYGLENRIVAIPSTALKQVWRIFPVCSIMSARFVGRLLHGSRSLRPAHSLFAARTAHSLGIRILCELGKRTPHRAVPALSWDSSRRLRPRRGAPHT